MKSVSLIRGVRHAYTRAVGTTTFYRVDYGADVLYVPLYVPVRYRDRVRYIPVNLIIELYVGLF